MQETEERFNSLMFFTLCWYQSHIGPQVRHIVGSCRVLQLLKQVLRALCQDPALHSLYTPQRARNKALKQYNRWDLTSGFSEPAGLTAVEMTGFVLIDSIYWSEVRIPAIIKQGILQFILSCWLGMVLPVNGGGLDVGVVDPNRGWRSWCVG